MEKFLVWFADSPIASFLRVALSFVIAAAVADFAKIGSFDVSNWQTWFIGALVSSIPLLLRWLNPMDYAFGKGS
ncbi:MAG: hypothetical protein WA061_02200 [Microgenomates group bacterium]